MRCVTKPNCLAWKKQTSIKANGSRGFSCFAYEFTYKRMGSSLNRRSSQELQERKWARPPWVNHFERNLYLWTVQKLVPLHRTVSGLGGPPKQNWWIFFWEGCQDAGNPLLQEKVENWRIVLFSIVPERNYEIGLIFVFLNEKKCTFTIVSPTITPPWTGQFTEGNKIRITGVNKKKRKLLEQIVFDYANKTRRDGAQQGKYMLTVHIGQFTNVVNTFSCFLLKLLQFFTSRSPSAGSGGI